MNVLVGCEFSGTVRDAFLRRGHNAYSCDLRPCLKGGHRHFQFDVRVALEVFEWDLFIVHPECTHLAASGAAHWAEPRSPADARNGTRVGQPLHHTDTHPLEAPPCGQ